VSSGERHERAVQRSLMWAQAAADAGDLADALRWLDVVVAAHGSLPLEWEERRERWSAELRRAGEDQ
jgi:hypothetical protein